MIEGLEFEHVTTNEAVDIFKSSAPIFAGILSEVRELSRKKPEATMSESKVNIVNRVLNDLLLILKSEPSGKFLEPLNSDALPQVSDAVLTMVQFETALKAFSSRYQQRIAGTYYWITNEQLSEWQSQKDEE